MMVPVVLSQARLPLCVGMKAWPLWIVTETIVIVKGSCEFAENLCHCARGRFGRDKITFITSWLNHVFILGFIFTSKRNKTKNVKKKGKDPKKALFFLFHISVFLPLSLPLSLSLSRTHKHPAPNMATTATDDKTSSGTGAFARADPERLLEGSEIPPFYQDEHVEYIVGLSGRLNGSFEGALTEHLKMSGVYWSLTAMALLLSPKDVDDRMKLTTDIATWVKSCFDASCGGYGAEKGHDGHLLYTLSAVQILAMADKLEIVPVDQVTDFVVSLQQPDGSFVGDKWGETDTRFTYCALSTLSILGTLDRVDSRKAAEYIVRCRNFDGGFGVVVGGESHAGQVFCCIGALSIAQCLHLLPNDGVLEWWLAERQCDSGGLNGRSEKQADVCYSWWNLSALSILGRVPFISGEKLAAFVLKCQDPDDGGIADRPDDMPDVYHTFFGIAGLSLLGYLHANAGTDGKVGRASMRRKIDPVYALPIDVVERLNLKAQVILHKGETLDERLKQYTVLEWD